MNINPTLDDTRGNPHKTASNAAYEKPSLFDNCKNISDYLNKCSVFFD